MRSLLFVIASFSVTICCWGMYGPLLHKGRGLMAVEGGHALWRPFICVGLAYMAIGIIVPAVLLKWRGEKGSFTATGVFWGLFAGTAGAIGALGILLSFEYGGRPVYVMPLVFGGAPVVNAFITIYLARKLREVGPVFLAGLIMVALGAVIVLIFKPQLGGGGDGPETTFSQVVLQIVWIALTILCWGCYGPLLHKGQEAMEHSRLRPLICVGIAYFVVAVVAPAVILGLHTEASQFRSIGSLWSLGSGAAGAFGALGVIMAFNFGGKPLYVMPLIFGGAPVVNSFWTIIAAGNAPEVSPIFYSGLILVIAGAAIVLVFAPRGKPAKAPDAKPVHEGTPQVEEKAGEQHPLGEQPPRETPGDAAAERPVTT